MKVSEYIVDFLASKGVTDSFGIPGGVILDLLYAFDESERITPHLSYHEQCAAFEASSYAQANGTVGVAYATRGPGIMNMVTSIADAYCDSVPLMVFTAHGSTNSGRIRVMDNQEFDLEPILSSITKSFIRIDALEEVEPKLNEAFTMAFTGRKGPVVIDVASKLWKMELEPNYNSPAESKAPSDTDKIIGIISESLKNSSRPVILAGDGIKQSDTVSELVRFAEKNRIPVLSSRYAEDLMPLSELYYGYIGSHGIRCANFILSKADLIIGLGNRMAFPVKSKSFSPIVGRSKLIRIELDEAELERDIPGAVNLIADLSELMPKLSHTFMEYNASAEWTGVCSELKSSLKAYDISEPVAVISEIMKLADPQSVITSDVGNNEFWMSAAYFNAHIGNRIIYSKTFGALGCSVAKAIGAYYASRKPVLCFTGDQGLQLNVQELQLISANRIPITIAVINNRSSGMIRCGEKNRNYKKLLHTTEDSGYAVPDVRKIASAYDISYALYNDIADKNELKSILASGKPSIVEVTVSEDNDVFPILKIGDECQKLYPYIDDTLYEKLNNL